MVHRGIRHILRGGTAETFPWSPAAVAALGQQCSFKERRADEATRDAMSWLKCEYMRDKLGEEFDALVTGVVDFGLFVQVKGLQVDGLVHVSALGTDYFSRDSSGFRMVGARSGRTVPARRSPARAAHQRDHRRAQDRLRARGRLAALARCADRGSDAGAAEWMTDDERNGRRLRAACRARTAAAASGARVAPGTAEGQGRRARGELLRIAQAAGVRTEWRDVSELDRLAGNERHQGACLQIRALGPLGEGALDELLDRATSAAACCSCWTACRTRTISAPACAPRMLPAQARSSCRAIALPGLTPTVRKVASGAAETMPLIQVVNLARTLRWLKERDVWIVGADDQAPKSVYEAPADRRRWRWCSAPKGRACAG